MNTSVMKELERAGGGLDGVKENGARSGDVEGSNNSSQPSKSKKKKNKKKKKKKKKNLIAENESEDLGGLGGLGGFGGNNATTTATATATITDNFDVFNDAKEAELLKSMGGGSMGDSMGGGGTNAENDDDGEEGLGLSSEELALMKIKLLEMKKERDEQRAARKMAWERRG